MRIPVVALAVVTALVPRSGGAPQPAPPRPPALAAPAPEAAENAGAYIFRTHCASCHGTDARGEGPLADSLRFRPSDLTLIARRNGGEFPTAKVIRIVDGRKPVKGHGGPDMPIWGDAFRSAETGYDDATAQARIRQVVDHLKTLQSK